MRALLLAVLLCGCASAVTPDAVRYSVPPIPRVIRADAAFQQYFANTRLRQVHNTELPDEEAVLCLYGVVRNDTAFIAFVRPTVTTPMGAHLVNYAACRIPNPEVFGRLKYLGSWHDHVGGVDCGFSTVDDASFARDTLAVLETVSCSKGLIGRHK